MSYFNWRAGMKAVCIATPEQIGKWQADAPAAICPTSDGIYTVREIRDDARFGGSKIVLLLSEISNAHMIGVIVKPGFVCFVEPGFVVEAFRPVQTRQTDISIFTQMLNPSKIKVGEPA